MAGITRTATLPDSADKADFYSLVDSSTVTGITNSDIDSAAAIAYSKLNIGAGAIADSKLAQITTASKVAISAIASLTGAIQVVIDGGGAAISTGKKIQIECPYAVTLSRYTMIADQSGSIVIDVNRSTYSGFNTTASICGSGKECTISGAYKAQDTDISNWTDVTIDAGDILEFEVDSCTDITRVTLSLLFTRTA